jgi:hypothetical protein
MKNIHILQENIYITSYEKFVRNEYITDGIKVMKATQKLVDAQGLVDRIDWKKIILTTDQDLIKDGVQAIDDEFLEWFVKNPSCEEVEVNRMFNVVQFTSREFIYKIIIPKEEKLTYSDALKKEERIFNSTMMFKQETLEEAAEIFVNNRFSKQICNDKSYPDIYASKEAIVESHILFAKWQQQSYSEEDMKEAFKNGAFKWRMHSSGKCFEEWFEQFKKK